MGTGGKLGQVDTLVSERVPQPLDEDVIHTAALAIHRDLDAGVLEDAREFETRELAPLVGVEDLRSTVALEGLFQGLDTNACI